MLVAALTFIISASTNFAYAAPCCASNAAIPSLIAGDQAQQVGVTTSYGSVIGDAPVAGIPVFRADNHSETTRTIGVDAATLITDRWQAGAGISAVDRQLERAGKTVQSSGMGDARISIAYEAWPEYRYTRWTPRGYVFTQATLPTGRSLYESREVGAIDARGQGFYQFAIGAALMKKWTLWDSYLIPELHASPAREFETAQVSSFWGGSVSAGMGVSPGTGALRVGLRLQPVYRSSRAVSSEGIVGDTASQYSWNSAIEATYLYSDSWMVSAAYVDQTLLGPAKNATLSRTATLGIQRRWDR